MSKAIPLTQNNSALVDDEDYDRLKSYQWFLSGPGYAAGFAPVDGRFKLTYMHRLILNASPDQLVDHINGNTLDNRRQNLR